MKGVRIQVTLTERAAELLNAKCTIHGYSKSRVIENLIRQTCNTMPEKGARVATIQTRLR